MIAAIGPLWSWHEVWLVGFGGTLFAVFPRLLASAFAGYYLALFLILWSLILRGISSKLAAISTIACGKDSGISFSRFPIFSWRFFLVLRRATWQRGVPLDAQGNFSMAFFTNFRVRGYVGLLDWYTVSIAIFAAVILAAHGATYLTLKTEGPST